MENGMPFKTCLEKAGLVSISLAARVEGMFHER